MPTKYFYRFQQVIIFVLHILLLKWILFVLAETNQWPATKVFFHFLGMGVFGAGLIVGCAKWAKYHHLKELRLLNKKTNHPA